MPSSRLKHFCQLCRKQCKDENGFKCHVNSVSHQLRVRQYANNPLQHMEKASRQFQGRFVQMIKTKYPGEPKYLEELYNELIQEKKFLKFNHTQWKSLADFGTYLQSVRNVQVIGAPPNCKILYLVNKTKDFIEANKKEKLQAERQRQKQQIEKSMTSRIQKQRQYATKKENQLNAKLLILQEERKRMIIPDKLELNIQGFNPDVKRSAFYTTEELQQQVNHEEPMYTRKLDKIEKLYEELKKNNKQQQQEEQQIEWIKIGITVKIKPHDIDPAFHNKKCKIVKIVEPFIAQLALGSANLQIDQTNIQTVIPKIGNQVMILYGKYQGKTGILKEVNLEEGFGIIALQTQAIKVSFNFFSRFDNE